MTRALACALLVLVAAPGVGRAQTRPGARAGDTIVVRTSGDVPETAVRRLTLDWKASVDVAAIGDIAGMAVAPDGRIYIWDPATPTIWLMSAYGKSLARVGRRGSGPGEYGRLNGLAVMKNGNLVAWDEGNTRVNFYDPNGKFLRSTIVPYAFCCPNNIVTADTLNRVWLYLMSGAVARADKADPASMRRPSAFLVLDETGAIRDTVEAPPLQPEFPSLTARGANQVSARTMPYGGAPRFVASPHANVVSGTGRPYVVNSAISGRPLRIESAASPVHISREERSAWRSSLEIRFRQVQPDWQWTGPDIPTEKPSYFDLRVGQDGRVWVALSVVSEAFTPAPQTNADAALGPPVGFRDREKRWDVYEPDGRFIARVAAPRAFTPYAMRGSTLWGVLRDADDVPTVVQMKF